MIHHYLVRKLVLRSKNLNKFSKNRYQEDSILSSKTSCHRAIPDFFDLIKADIYKDNEYRHII